MNITHYGTCPECLGEGAWLVLNEIKEDSKVENVKVIRKLEDFDGLENGMGLRFEILRECYNGDIYDFLILTTEEKEFQRWNLKYQKHLISCFVFFKAMGFEFEYKPLRTKEEVLKDMERLSCEKSDSCKTMVFWVKKDKKYIATDDVRTPLNAKVYFNDNVANDFANELNEIIKNS